jgi:hypothetical protein
MAVLMRAAVVAVAAVAACSPQIADGSYFCGPQELCPSGDACNGPDNTCVTAAFAMPFACPAGTQHEPDNTPAEAVPLPTLSCVSTAFADMGCLGSGDTADWVSFLAPSGCLSLVIHVSVEFPTAFEPITLLLQTADGTQVGSDADCVASTPGTNARCLTAQGSAGVQYDLGFLPSAMNCGGACGFNSYSFGVSVGVE